MECGVVKSSFYNGTIASLTTSNMSRITKIESDSRIEICPHVERYEEGMSILLTLNPIVLNSSIEEPIEEPIENIIRDNIENVTTIYLSKIRKLVDLDDGIYELLRDIRSITGRLLFINSGSEEYISFLKNASMYIYDEDGSKLLNIYSRISDREEDKANILYSKIENIFSRSRYLDNMSINVQPIYNGGISDVLMSCDKDSDYVVECDERLRPFSSEELNAIQMNLEPMAIGGFGSIHRAIYNKEEIAIKLTDYTSEEELSNEICNQDLASKSGISPRILSYWKCSEKKRAVIIMDYIPSVTLAKYTQSDNAKVIEAILNAVSTILYMNLELLIIHRDLHLHNILVSNNDIYIIDFGFSKARSYNNFDIIDIGNLFEKHLLFYTHLMGDKGYGVHNVILFNQIYNQEYWEVAYNSRKYWEDIYNEIFTYFGHLLNDNKIVIPKFSASLEFIEYGELSFDDIKYINVEVTRYNTIYYYGIYRGKKITIAISPNNEQFEIHKIATSRGIAPKVLTHFKNGNRYVLVYENNGTPLDMVNFSNNSVIDILNEYLNILRVILVLNLELHISLGLALTHAIEFVNAEYIPDILINKFPLARRINVMPHPSDVKIDTEKITFEYAMLSKFIVDPSTRHTIYKTMYKSFVVNIYLEEYYKNNNKVPNVDSVIEHVRKSQK